jgi:predicted nucleic acid-binding protein
MPWQVLCELVRQLRYWQDKKQLTRDAMLRYVAGFRRLFPVVMPTVAVLDRALALSARYSLSHWDSILLGACLEANVTTLFTEDMGSPCVYDGLQLVNPFT